MYVICTYDVESKRCAKYMKILRKYLFHIQESVFEGELTPKQYKKLTDEINKILTNDDHIIFYYTYNQKQILKKEIGRKEEKTKLIL